MTEPANVTTGSGEVADGSDTGPASTATDPAERGDPASSDSGTDGDADLVTEH